MLPDERVLRALARIESNDNPHAMRFEPHVYDNRSAHPTHIINAIVTANKCSRMTAAVIYSTSFGCWQLMGFNIYAPWCAYGGSIGKYLNAKEDQRGTILKFLERNKLSKYRAEDLLKLEASRNFAKLYNGPGNVEVYSAKLRNVLAQIV